MDLFGTAGIRGAVRTRVTPELALAVGRAAGVDAREQPRLGTDDPPTFVLGRDGRTTGEALAAAVSAGLTSAGVDVVRVGQVPTPALAFATRGRRGVMVTASHNPPTDNGLKLFVDGVEYDSAAEARITRHLEPIRPRLGDGADAAKGTSDLAARASGADTSVPPDATAGAQSDNEGNASIAPWTAWGRVERAAPLGPYCETVIEYATDHGTALEGLQVVVDCGNGMASLATPQVLRELGARVIALNANVDGHVPGRGSKPTPETLHDLRADVGRRDGAIGIGHDGDADRIVIVDETGDILHEDTVLAMLASHFTRRCDREDPVVVTTPNASARIDERVEAAGGRVVRVRLGALHEGIASVRADGGPATEVVFAAEPWKHIHPALGGWIDGVASAAVLARLVAAHGLDTLREPVTERPYRKESLACPDDVKSAVMTSLEAALPETFPAATVDTAHGVRLTFADGGWVLVRPSGTEPKIRIYAERDDVDDLVEGVRSVVEATVADATGDLE